MMAEEVRLISPRFQEQQVTSVRTQPERNAVLKEQN